MTKYLLTKPGGPWDFPALGFSAVDGAILDGDLPVAGTFTSAPGPEWSTTTGTESGINRYAPPSTTVTYSPIPVPQGLVDSVGASLLTPGSPAQVALSAAIGARAAKTYDIRQFVNAGETLTRDGSGVGNNSAILQRAVDALTALYAADGIARQVYFPNGTYKLATGGTDGAHAASYAVKWATGVGICGESEAGTVFVSAADSTPFYGAYGGQLADCQFENFTIDGSAQTNATYTTQLKGMFMQDMLRPRWNRVTIKNCWATGLGCDYLQNYAITQVTTTGNGRGIAATGSNPLNVSGGSGVGIGTGKYQNEAGVISGLLSTGNGRGGLFFEKQQSVPYLSRGVKVIGAILTGNYFGIQDCGLDGLDAELVATDNTYAGVFLHGTVLTAGAGINGRIYGTIDRNGTTALDCGNVVLGYMPAGNYTVGGARTTAKASPNFGVVALASATIGPRVTIDLAADSNGASGVYVRSPGTVSRLTIAGSASNNGQNAALTLRHGVVVECSTDMLNVAAEAVDDQATATQQTGLYLKGSGASASRAKLAADLRGNVTPYLAEQVISNDSINTLIIPPTGPSRLTVTGVAANQVTLSWTAPTSTTGLTDYAIQYRTSDTGSGAGAWTTFAHTAGAATSRAVTSLTDATRYDFQVAAVISGTTGAYTAGPVSAAPWAAPTIADDPSNNADGTVAGTTAGDGTSSATWLALVDGGSGGAFQSASGKFKATAGSGNVFQTLDAASADGAISLVVAALPTTDAVSGIAFRFQDATNLLRVALRQTTGNKTYTLQRVAAGASTNLITSTVRPAVGDVVRVTMVGSAVKLYVNDVLLGSATVTNFQTLTKHGMYGNFSLDTGSAFGKFGFSPTI